MTIKRYNSEKDNTLVNALKDNLSSRGTTGNMGASDILEVFSIFGQASTSSLEQSRVLLEFPVKNISKDRDLGILPLSGSATFKLKMSNTPHGQTTPKNYTLIAHPVVRPWTEGDGLDMENYLDIEASNWASASDGVAWHTAGCDFASSSYIKSGIIPYQYTQSFSTGVENLEIDITQLTEEWIKNVKQSPAAKASTGSLNFLQNASENQVVSIYSHEGKRFIYTFVTSSTHSINNNVFLKLSGTAAATAGALEKRIKSDFGGKITTNLVGAKLSLTQSVAGLHGNTILSSSAPTNTIEITGFSGGTTMPNYGLVVKLRDDYENGSKKRSYYTKKFYSRSSHEFFLKPQIEAQWDSALKDDRNYILKSSSMAPSSENINNIYHYNKIRGNLLDIPNTGSRVVVQLFPTLGSAPASIVQSGGTVSTYITASKAQTGIYKASFAYSGSASKLHDVWQRHDFTAAVPAAKANVTIKFTGPPDDTQTIILTDSSNNQATFIAKAGGTQNNGSQDGGGNFEVGASGATADFVQRLFQVIQAQTAVAITATDPSGGNDLTLTQDANGAAGNKQITNNFANSSMVDSSDAAATGFTGGVTAAAESNTYTTFFTGSGFTVYTDSIDSSYAVSNYVVNITNLKPSYLQGEKATFRVYTRNKNWSPNVYTKASQAAPVDTIKELFYKITKVSDNYEVISYSTGSTPSYSELSYDKDGSYFDLDMSLLEKNNAYQINFVFKEGPSYIELTEKFRFRVDP